MEKFKIKESALPAGAKIDKKPKSLFEAYPQLVIGMVAGISALIIGFLVFFTITQRRKNTMLLTAQKSLHTAEEMIEKDRVILQAKEQQSQFLETAPVVFVVATDGVVKVTNTYAQSTLGISNGTQLEKCFVDGKKYTAISQKVKNLGKMDGEVVEVITTTGEVRSFFITISSIYYEGKEAEVMWAIDVEDNEQQHNLLKKLQADLQSVLDSLPVGVLISDIKSLKPIYVNTAYIKIFGFKSLELALKCSKLEMSPALQPDGKSSAQFIKTNLETMNAGDETISYEWQYELKKGHVLEAKIYDRKIIYNGEVALVSIIQDITTDKKQAELLLLTAEKEKDANKIKSRFVINMSHEIRTPMNAIIGLSEIALMKSFEKEVDDTFKKINTSAKNLLSIINDVLDFSKIEAEKLELFEEEFVLEDTLSNASLMASQRIEDKPIEMLLQLDVSIPRVLYGDKTRLWQIFKNLLDNSAKFTESGRIILSASFNPVLTPEGKTLITFVVKDTGLGMSQQQLDKLYVPFEQFHQNHSNAFTGTGLGMSITKQLVELMSGVLKVESQQGVGTTTTITIPLKAATKDGILEDAILKDSLKGKRVLAADDDPISLEIMEYLMTSVGILPTCVPNGEEALICAQQSVDNNTPYDIVLLDYKMEGQNGIEVAKKLKEIITLDKAKILVVSAYATQFLSGDIKAAGFDEIIEKPYSPTEFIQKLYNSINVKKATLKTAKQINFEGAAVLVVEDNLINQEVADSMLQIFGITPVIANNGKEALEILEKHKFQLVLMDLLMPIMDGHETTKRIRQSNKQYKNVPIVAMTANVVKEEIDACLAEGMDGHIGKPIDINVLSIQLSKWLSASTETKAEEAMPVEKEIPVEDITQIKGVDFDAGVARFGGKKEKYIKLLGSFASQYPESIMPFAEAISEENIKQTSSYVHTLKGTAGNLSVTSVYEAAIEFEKTLKNNQPDEALYNQLFELYAQINKDISKVIE